MADSVENLVDLLELIAEEESGGRVTMIGYPGSLWKVALGYAPVMTVHAKRVLEEIPGNMDLQEALEYAIVKRPKIEED